MIEAVGPPVNEGTVTGFILNISKMFQTSTGASISGLIFFTVTKTFYKNKNFKVFLLVFLNNGIFIEARTIKLSWTTNFCFQNEISEHVFKVAFYMYY